MTPTSTESNFPTATETIPGGSTPPATTNP
jgi:hypothetical protein